MNLVFDIDDDNYVSVTIVPDNSEDETELHNIAMKLNIRNPAPIIVQRAKSGAFNHLTREQYQTYLHKIKKLERFFAYQLNGGQPKPVKTNVFMLLERTINCLINAEDDEEGDNDDE